MYIACTLIIEIENFLEMSEDSGVALKVSNFGFYDFMETLIYEYLHPLIKLLFSDCEELLDKKKYSILPKIMAYSFHNGNKDWHKHIDGDIATLNICLTDKFNGANLRVFDKNDNDKYIDYNHNQSGNAIIHKGDILHSVTPLKSGKRCTLIVKFNKIGQNW